jgi:t-SNARE complex subunit (syntaxin)
VDPKSFTRAHRQVHEILELCASLEAKLNHVSVVHSSEQYEAVIMLSLRTVAVRSLILEDQNSEEMVAEVVQKMRGVVGLMENMREIVEENQGDLERVEGELDVAMGRVAQAGEELDEAVRLRRSTRVIKMRLYLSGVLAGLGYFLVGLPGVIASFFLSWRLF